MARRREDALSQEIRRHSSQSLHLRAAKAAHQRAACGGKRREHPLTDGRGAEEMLLSGELEIHRSTLYLLLFQASGALRGLWPRRSFFGGAASFDSDLHDVR